MRTEHQTEQGTTGRAPALVDLRDLGFAAIANSPFARVLPRPVGFYPATPLQQLLTAWEAALEIEAEQPAASYPREYEAAFDAPGAAPIAFADLPLGLQEILGGSATDAWYRAAAEARGGDRQHVLRALPPAVIRFLRSTWTRRRARVADLDAYLLTPYAVEHHWPVLGASTALVTPHLGLDFSAIFAGRSPATPMVVYQDSVHRDLVAFGLALLRALPPQTEIRWLEGRPGAASDGGPIPEPRYPKSAWTADGASLRSPDAPGRNPAERELLRARVYTETDALRQARRGQLVDHCWSAMGLGEMLAVHRTPFRHPAELPFADDAPPIEAQRLWSSVGTGRNDRSVAARGGVIAAVGRWLAGALPDALVSPGVHGSRALTREHAHRVRASLQGARVTQVLPDVRAVALRLTDRAIERAARAAA